MQADGNGRGARDASRSQTEQYGQNDRLSLYGRAVTRRTSLSLPPGLPLSEWRHLGRQIYLISDSSAWWLGDWLIYGQTHYPDRYKRAILETSLDYQTLRNYAWIARKFPLNRRRPKVSFQHHAEVASLPPEEQDAWLAKAEAGGWSRNELRSKIRASRNGVTAAAEKSLVRVDVLAERKERWEKAAQASELDLQAWIVATLDNAAMEAIEEGGLP